MAEVWCKSREFDEVIGPREKIVELECGHHVMIYIGEGLKFSLNPDYQFRCIECEATTKKKKLIFKSPYEVNWHLNGRYLEVLKTNVGFLSLVLVKFENGEKMFVWPEEIQSVS